MFEKTYIYVIIIKAKASMQRTVDFVTEKKLKQRGRYEKI